MRKTLKKRCQEKHDAATPSRQSARSHWAFGILVASAALGGAATPAFAQNAPTSPRPAGDSRALTRRFDIAPGSLHDALLAFTRATGLTINDPKAVVSDAIISPGATGTFTAEDALRHILRGTGITYRFTNARALRLEIGELPPEPRPGAARESATLDAVTVTARAERPSSGKYTEPLRDVPQTVTIVPHRVLEQQGVTTLRDALRNVAGLTVNAGEGGATPGDNFNVRGFSARDDIFVDGVRDAGGYSRDAFDVEQVEVAKGPSSTYTGRGSTGGSVNVVTKAPHPDRAWSATLGAGSAGYGRATVDLNQPIADVGVPGAAVRVAGMWQDAGVPSLDVVHNSSWGVAPSLAIGLGTPTQLTAAYSHLTQDNVPSYGIQSFDSLPAVDTHHFFGLQGLDRERVSADRATARVEHAASGSLTLRNQLAFARSDVHRIVTYANPDGTRHPKSHITHDANLSDQASLNASFATGAARHDVAAGVELSHETSRFANYRFSTDAPTIADLAHPDPNDPYTGDVTVAPPRRDVTANAVGVYAFETLKLGERWQLSGGARWDYFAPTYRDSTGADVEPHTTSRALTWRAGAVFAPAPNGSVYAAYGTSFNPSGELLALDRNGTSGLDPERNRSVELGTKWDLFRERLSLSAAAFRTEKTNARITDPDDPLGKGLVLAGRQRVQGVELGASGHIGAAWSLFAGYTFLDSRIVTGDSADVGEPLPNTPRHSASVWSTYDFPWRLEVGAGARHVGARYVRGSFWVPGYTTVDAEASYPVARGTMLRLNLYNLANATYYDTGRFWVPAPGRSVRITAELEY